MSSLLNFLIVFDHDSKGLVEAAEYGTDVNRALIAYADAEELHRQNDRMEIVLVAAESLEMIMKTHSAYFGFHAESPHFAGL